jgi:hypothetical protein
MNHRHINRSHKEGPYRSRLIRTHSFYLRNDNRVYILRAKKKSIIALILIIFNPKRQIILEIDTSDYIINIYIS